MHAIVRIALACATAALMVIAVHAVRSGGVPAVRSGAVPAVHLDGVRMDATHSAVI